MPPSEPVPSIEPIVGPTSAAATREDKEAFLVSDAEFTLDAIQDEATRNIIKRLTRKQPAERLTLNGLKNARFVHMQDYTKTIELSTPQ